MRNLLNQARGRLRGRPEAAQGEAARWWIDHGSPGQAVLALRSWALAPEPPPAGQLLALLDSPVPALRRVAAWTLGQGQRVQDLDPIWARARRERVDAVRLALCVACVRLGVQVDDAWGLLDQAARRRMLSSRGSRAIAEATGFGPDQMARRWLRVLDPWADGSTDPATVAPLPAALVRERLIRRLDADSEDRDGMLSLAYQQHPGDFERIAARVRMGGRREAHTTCEALGENGDPRAIDLLVPTLRAMDVDPGHGFAGRRAASVALGRLGLPEVGPILASALQVEAADYEGRPGAGMGIQFPVRAVMISALGEAGCVRQAGVIAGYLGDVSGSAFGGFYLPAMDALWKLDAWPELVAALQAGPTEATHAAAVLQALGRQDLLPPRQGEPKGLSGS